MKNLSEEMTDLSEIILQLQSENNLLKLQVAQEKSEKEMEILKRQKTEEELMAKTQEVEELKATTKHQAAEIKKFKVEIKVLNAKVQTLEEESILYQDKLYEAVKLENESKQKLEEVSRKNMFLNIDTVNMIAEQQHLITYLSENNKFLNHEAEDLVKYKNNYYVRKEDTEYIMKYLEQLEIITTQFSFLRRRTSKKKLINRVRNMIQRSNNID